MHVIYPVMRGAYVISLVVMILLVGGLARRGMNTSAELLPLASAVSWVEGRGRALESDLIGVGIRPGHVARIGKDFVPRMPPVMMVYYGAVVKSFRAILGRPLDGADLNKLTWVLNFAGVLPWALLLFGAMAGLAGEWGAKEETQAVWAAWAAMAGALGFGWLGVVSVYLPVAAISTWCVLLVMRARRNRSMGTIVLAGLLAGLAGAWHPSGWIWAVWGILFLFVAQPEDVSPSGQAALAISFGVSAAVGVVISAVGNAVFFGSPLPIQWIDLQSISLDVGGIVRLLWHDLIGFNGIVWMAPLVLPGLIALWARSGEDSPGSVLRFLFVLATVTLLIWGIADDARVVSELGDLPQQLRVIPVELTDGRFSIVQLGQSAGGDEGTEAYVERLVSRTDVFLGLGGRAAGLPLFLPVGLLVGLLGWINMASSRFWSNWMWIGVRWGGLIGLIMSQAPYGSASEIFTYTASAVGDGRMPIVEALLAVCLRLAEFWPSGVVGF